MHQNKSFVVTVDDAALEIDRGINALMAIHTAIAESSFSPESFTDGLFFVLTRLDECNKNLRRAISDERSLIYSSKAGGEEDEKE